MTTTRHNQSLYRRFKRIPLFQPEPARLKRGSVLPVFLAGFLLFSLAACSAAAWPTTTQSHATTGAVEHSSPTPTPLPPGIVLYQANWSHGLAGWSGTHGWQVMRGQIETNTNGSALLTIPYQPSVSNYAVEVRLQIVRLLSSHGGSFFSIFASKAHGKDGYQAGVSNLVDSVTRPFGTHPQSQVFLDPSGDTVPGSGLPSANYPGFGWHTYRVEVQDKQARLLDDGVQIGIASSQQATISNGPLGLSSGQVVLRVSSIRILTL